MIIQNDWLVNGWSFQRRLYYRARNATSRQWRTAGNAEHPFASSQVFLVGDSAIGSPYFQSISLGFECAMYLHDLLGKSSAGVEITRPLLPLTARWEML